MEKVCFYLKPGAIQRMAAGERTMPGRVAAALTEAGWQVAITPDAERAAIPDRDGWHLVVNEPVPSERCLTLRVAGFEPFWQIERTNDRWDWETAAKPYAPPEVPEARLAEFLTQWRHSVLKGAVGTGGGGILVPLQGKLNQIRPFQAASPITMLAEVLRHWPDRSVTATTHPREVYEPADLKALATLQADFPNFRSQSGGTEALLPACDLVVTQNSTVALKGYLVDKPAMLWARIDWHHVAASVPRDGRDRAFAEAGRPRDHARYLFWYLRRQSLFAWEDNSRAIRWRLRALGWPVREPK